MVYGKNFVVPESKFLVFDVYLYSFDGVNLKKEFGSIRIYNKNARTTFRPEIHRRNSNFSKIVSSEEGELYSKFVWFKDQDSDDKALKLFIEKYDREIKTAQNKLKKLEKGKNILENLLNKKEV